MSNPTDKENSIFISYAHIDNKPVLKGKEGWVASFHESLTAYVEHIAGETHKVWRDTSLGGNDYLLDVIEEQLSKAAVLVCVLSPRYVLSESCTNELKEFVRISNQNGGIRIDNQSLIFKILIFPIDRKDQPEELQEQQGHDFFKIDEASGKPHAFRVEFGPEAEQAYLAKVYDLALEICEVLKKLKTPDKAAPVPEEKKVYLAETTPDLSAKRDEIKAALVDRECLVLPNKDLSNDSETLRHEVQEALEQSAFSIHLIGKKYDTVVQLQNDLAAERLNNGFTRFIWLPRGLRAEEERQKDFINYLLKDPVAQKGAEVLRDPLENLKDVVVDKLTAKPGSNGKHQASTGRTYVYLICDEVDYEDTADLEEYLAKQGYEVVLPAFSEGKSADFSQRKFRETHYENLANCDVAIIYYGQCDSRWVGTKVKDFSKTYALGRPKKKEFLAKALYLVAPDSEGKRGFQTDEQVLLIENFKNFSPNALKPFVEQIAKAKNGKS